MENQIKKYDAITLDTNIFHKNAYDFTKENLLKLQQFKHKYIDFILSNIVAEEIKKHLKQNQIAKKKEFNKALKNSQTYFLLDNKKLKDIEDLINSQNEEIAWSKFDEYRQECGIQIIYCHEFDILKRITDAYFQNKPPFEETGDKKAEFPDAMALFSLEQWAKENDKKILATSDDNDWKNFAQSSEYIDVVPDLNALIEIVQNQLNNAEAEIIKLDDTLDLNIDAEFINFLILEVSNFIDNADLFTIKADSPYTFYYDDVYIEFKNLNLKEDTIKLLEKNDNSFVISLECSTEIDISAHFNMFIYDSIDKEDIFIGSSTETVTQVLEIYLEIDFWTNDNVLEKEIAKIEFCSTPIIEIGTVIPEYNYDPEFYGD